MTTWRNVTQNVKLFFGENYLPFLMELYFISWNILAELFVVQNFLALSALFGGVGWGYLNSGGRA